MSSSQFFDIHSHLNFSDYGEDREDVIKRMKDSSVWTVAIGSDKKSSIEALELAKSNPEIFACVGVHPDDNREEKFDEKLFRKLVSDPKVVAVGECGLDYFRLSEDSGDEKKRQAELFRKHIDLALETGKPLMIHARPSNGTFDAYLDVLEIIKSYKEPIKANMHFFAGDLEIAKKFLNLGFSFSFTGVITFARNYDEVIKYLPLDKIMAETDAPFVAPLPWRGKRNEPTYVIEVVKKIAEIRGEKYEDVKVKMVQNAFDFFGLN